MSGLTKAKGNMYEWVTHVWNPIDGKCPHACPYCYVQDMAKRFPAVKQHYSGPLRLAKPFPNLGEGKTIFVGHMTDLFCDDIPDAWILEVLQRCFEDTRNSYIFQTKNPERACEFQVNFPMSVRIGTTTETNRTVPGNAPQVHQRLDAMRLLRQRGETTFVTIEPVLDFDPHPFATILINANPCFVNIGADSHGTGLAEPPEWKIEELITRLKAVGIQVNCKRNLVRIKS